MSTALVCHTDPQPRRHTLTSLHFAGDVFSVDVARTWEFNPKFPIRNMLVPQLVFGPPLYLLRFLTPYTERYLNVDLCTPYYLLTVPRLVLCLLSFINDYCIYRICVLYGHNYKTRLTIFASSYVTLVYCCRGFSNSFEMILFSVLLMWVAECMVRSDNIIYHEEFLSEKYNAAQTAVERVKLYKLRRRLPSHSVSGAALVATVTVVGIFNRPTFVGFAMPPLFFWLHRGLGSKVIGFKDFNYRFFLVIVCGIPPTLALILVDSVYYGYLTLADVEYLRLSSHNWVVTPLNFLIYNSDVTNLTVHGLHPRWTHLAINAPLLFHALAGLAAVAFCRDAARLLRGRFSRLPRVASLRGLLLGSLWAPLALLSLVPHQEARFIVPALVPLVCLFGGRLHSRDRDGPAASRARRVLRAGWYVANAMLAIFFGFVHQAGVYPLVESLHTQLSASPTQRVMLLTSHTYSVPAYLLQLPRPPRSPRALLARFGSLPAPALLERLDDRLSTAERELRETHQQYRLQLAAPCPLDARLRAAAARYPYLHLRPARDLSPHFSSEAPPVFPGPLDTSCRSPGSSPAPLGLLARTSCYLSQFCLRVYDVQLLT